MLTALLSARRLVAERLLLTTMMTLDVEGEGAAAAPPTGPFSLTVLSGWVPGPGQHLRMAKAAGAGEAVGPVPLPQHRRGPAAGKACPQLTFFPGVGHTWNKIHSSLGSMPTGLHGGLKPAQPVPAPGPLHLLPRLPRTLWPGSSRG